LAALAAVIALALGGAMLSGARGPWDVGEAGWPSHSNSSVAGTAAEPTATATATVTVSVTPGASVTGATASASAIAAPTRAPTTAPHVTPAPLLADLGIGGYSNPWLVCGIEFDMQISVRNHGPAASQSTSARLVDRFGSTVAAQTVAAVPALAVDAHVDVHLPFTVRTGCGVLHTLTITVDPDDLVPETNEPNVLERTHTPLAKPNLNPAGLTVPTAPRCATNFTVSVTVVNNGYGPALDGIVTFADKYGTLVLSSTQRSFPSIPAPGTATVSATMKSSMYCNHVHSLVVTVDSTHLVSEMYEDDNVTSRNFTPTLGG
jgi:hypothetical protein